MVRVDRKNMDIFKDTNLPIDTNIPIFMHGHEFCLLDANQCAQRAKEVLTKLEACLGKAALVKKGKLSVGTSLFYLV